MPSPHIRGLIPVRHLHGKTDFQKTLRPTGNGAKGKNDSTIFIGDVVFLDASGAVQRYCDAASGGDTVLPLGVVGDVYNSNRRPFTFNQPGAGPAIPASTMGYVGVYEDPHIVYVANTSATATYLNVGHFAQIRVCAANTAAGRSGMSVDITTTPTAAGHAFKMVGISPLDGSLEESRLSGAANNDVEVIMVNGQWSNSWMRNVVAAIDVSGVTT